MLKKLTPQRSNDARIWRKDHPKICPWCGQSFLCYAPEGHNWPKYKVDEGYVVAGDIIKRMTCDDCWELEDTHEWRMKMARLLREGKIDLTNARKERHGRSD